GLLRIVHRRYLIGEGERFMAFLKTGNEIGSVHAGSKFIFSPKSLLYGTDPFKRNALPDIQHFLCLIRISEELGHSQRFHFSGPLHYKFDQFLVYLLFQIFNKMNIVVSIMELLRFIQRQVYSFSNLKTSKLRQA